MPNYQKKNCLECKKERIILAKGLCTTCYRKNRITQECLRCKNQRSLVAKGLCLTCYNTTKGYTGQPYRAQLIRSGILIKCVFCLENREPMLDVHHIDNNHKNNELNNLTWVCPNHHREAHLGYINFTSDLV